MNQKERIIETQKLTNNYNRTAELLDLSYDEIRANCEGDE